MAVQQDTAYMFPRVVSVRIYDYKPFRFARSPGRNVVFVDGLKEVGQNLNRLLVDSQGFRLWGQPSCLEFPSVSYHANRRSRSRITIIGHRIT